MFRMMVLIVSMALATCSLSANAASKTARHVVHVIVIDKMQYGSMPTDVHAGDSIEWVNHDIFEHSATARNGLFDVDLKPGTSGRITAVTGTLEFFCKFHPGMTGNVVVK